MLRHSLTKYGELSRTDQYGDKPTGKSPGRTQFLVRKTLCHSLICREEVCSECGSLPDDPKILPSRDPFAISFMCDSGRHRDGRAKKLVVPKNLCLCLLRREGVFVRGSVDWGTSSDWFSLARARFARHRTEKPSTKAGQIRALWPDIDAALQGGQA